MFFPVIFYI